MKTLSYPDELIKIIEKLPHENAHPMSVLMTCVSTLSMYDEETDQIAEEANYRKAIRLQAKMASIVAAYSRICEGKKPLMPKPSLSFAANFYIC